MTVTRHQVNLFAYSYVCVHLLPEIKPLVISTHHFSSAEGKLIWVTRTVMPNGSREIVELSVKTGS